MATLEGEGLGLGLHKPQQDIMMSPWAVAALQRYNNESGGEDHDLQLPTTFDIDYQHLSLLLQEAQAAAILYHPQCAKPKPSYPTIVQPCSIPVTVTTPVVPAPPLRSRSVTVGGDPYYCSEGNNRSTDLFQGPTHTTTDCRVGEYDTSAVPLRLRRRKHNILPFSDNSMMAGHQKSTSTSTYIAKTLWTGTIKPAVLLGIKPGQLRIDGFTVRTLEFEVPLDHHTSLREPLKLHAELVDSFCHNSNKPSPDALSNPPIFTQKPFILYLCGGPGDGNPSDRVPELNKFCIERGYQVLYVHYRGTGLSPLFSSPGAKNKVMQMSDQDKAIYLSKFRQDNIVRDLEAIRLCLNKYLSLTKEKEIKWTLIGQSFGGWVSTTYLSFLPSSLEAVYISAGMPPLGKTPREVYEKTYAHIVRRNGDYFEEYFPKDQEYVRRIVEHLRDEAPFHKGADGRSLRGYELYGEKGERKGCYLTYQTFMTLGRTFGSAPVVRRDRDMDDEGGEGLPLTSSIVALTIKPSKSSLTSSSVTHTTDADADTPSASYRSSATSFTSISGSDLSSLPDTSSSTKAEIPCAYAKLHNLITHLITDLSSSSSGGISQETLTLYTTLESFALHRRPLYALLHEAIYCSSTCPQTSQPSNWAANEVALSHPSGSFSWLSSSPSTSSQTGKPDNMKGKGKEKYYFTGETLHPSPLSALGGPSLAPFLGAANILAQKTDWPALYSLPSLQQNRERVRVRAVAYQEDMYVDLGLSKQAAEKIGGCELVVCPFRSWSHGSIKEVGKTEMVLGWLFDGV